ncbi:MAG: hypothetical protein HY001_04450 [Candidatus Portnoybacteria bacterium]|nr:hypothetical protein [Candidatus Portnoybacteria bacterium]
MNYRVQKQIIIGFITLIIITGATFLATSVFIKEPEFQVTEIPKRPAEPKLGNIEIVSTEFFEVKKFNSYDAVAYIRNPNLDFGAPKFSYEFIFFDETNQELARIGGSSFILPGQTRYIVESAVRFEGTPKTIDFKIGGVSWQKLAHFMPLGLNLRDVTFQRNEEMNSISVTGIVDNKSPYNLKDIEVSVILENTQGETVSAGKTNMQDLIRGTSRFFKIEWPYLLPYVEVDARVESNFFENSNFIRDYGR